MRDEFEKEGNAYQYQDSSQSKKYTTFSTERLLEIRQHVFLKLSLGQDSRYVTGKILLITTKLDLSREFILM